MVKPAGIVASAWLSTMLTATAAATVTDPSEVWADGVGVALGVARALIGICRFGKVRAWLAHEWSAIAVAARRSRPAPDRSCDVAVVVGPPVALAFDETRLAADPSASNVTPPPWALMERSVVAVVWSVAKARAIETPAEAASPSPGAGSDRGRRQSRVGRGRRECAADQERVIRSVRRSHLGLGRVVHHRDAHRGADRRRTRPTSRRPHSC